MRCGAVAPWPSATLRQARRSQTGGTLSESQSELRVDFDGKRYQETSAHQKEWGARLIDELDLAGNECILDVGCGDGTLTANLADAVSAGSVVGIDTSEGMIEAAQNIHRANLSFRLIDILDAEFQDEFDVIFSNATLHWIKDHQMLLEIFCRALKRSGVVRVNFAGEGNCGTFNRVALEVMASEEFSGAFSDFEWPWYMPSVEAYEKLVGNSSFSSLRVWGENADRFFPDTQTMLGWVDHPAVIPFKQYLDSETGSRFHEVVTKRMVEETRQTDGTCFETFRRINLLAVK